LDVVVVKWFGRLVGALLLAAVAWPLATPAARAEDLLVTSDPYEHQQLADAPSWVTLAFARAVDAAAAQIVVTNSAGKSVNINSLVVEGTNVAVQVQGNLPKGTYTVHYQVNRKDGQVEGGAFQFSYGKGTWTTLEDRRWSGNTAQPTVIASAQADPLPTTTASATPTATDTAVAPSASPTASTPSAAPGAAATGADATPWLWGGAAVLLALAAGAIAWNRRQKPKA
jgi:methionine-rich copper-binding protein CopC